MMREPYASVEIGWGLRENEQVTRLVQQFPSFVMIFSLVYINLSGTEVLGWCVVELFRCVRDTLAGWTTMKVMCVFGC